MPAFYPASGNWWKPEKRRGHAPHWLIVKLILFEVSGEVPPPYMPPGVPGLVTVTVAVPDTAMSELGKVTIIWLALMKVLFESAVPFQSMVALLLKFVPFTVSTTPVIPAVALSGASWLMFGVVPGEGGVVEWEP
jgi:hypothetical protein